MEDIKQSNARVIKVILGCGGALALTVGGLVTAAAYFLSGPTVIGPEEMRALAAEMLPGSSVPAGYRPKVASTVTGERFVVFRTSAASSIVLIETTAADLAAGSGLAHELELNGRRVWVQTKSTVAPPNASGVVVSSTSKVVHLVGGQRVTFEHSSYDEQGERREANAGSLYYPGGKAVVIIFSGPEGDLDRAAMDKYLASVSQIPPAQGR